MSNKPSSEPTLEAVGIKSFSQAVSSYIHKATLGVRILISDRGRIVAELIRPNFSNAFVPGTPTSDPAENSVLKRDWLSAGTLELGTTEKRAFPRGEPLLQGSTATKIIAELRGE